MAFNIVRTGTSAVVGIASGALAGQAALTTPIGPVSISALAEGVALVGGVALQFLSPMTMPSLVDGLVDGGIALLARRGAAHLMSQMGGGSYPGPGGLAAGHGYRMNGAYYGTVHSPTAPAPAGLAAPRGQTVGQLPKVRVQ